VLRCPGFEEGGKLDRGSDPPPPGGERGKR